MINIKDTRKAPPAKPISRYTVSFVTMVLLLSFFFFFLPATAAGSAHSDEESEIINDPPYMGNVSEDSSLNVGDAIKILRHIVGLTDLKGDLLQRADVNFDGDITVTDAILVLRHIVGLIETFPTSDPALVSTEEAFHYLINKTAANQVDITGDIELTREVSINRDITVNGAKTGTTNGTVTVEGNLSILKEAETFTVGNLTWEEGKIIIKAAETDINFHAEDSCDIKRAVFYRDASVTGGDNINSALLGRSVHVNWIDDKKPPVLDYEASKLRIEEQPAGSTDGSGEVGEIRVIAADRNNNKSTYGLNENSTVTAHLSNGNFTNDSVVTKELGAEGTVTFAKEELIIEGDKSTVNLTITFESNGLNSVTSHPFHVLGLSSIDGEESGVVSIYDSVEAGEGNIELRLTIKDASGSPVEGAYFTSVGDGWYNSPLTYDEKGEAKLKITQTTADKYSEINVSVDGFATGTFDVTVTPGPPERIDFYEDEYKEWEVIQPGESTDILVIVTDRYRNPVEDVDVEVDLKLDGEEVPFAGESTSRQTDSDGIAVFDDLLIDDYGIYEISFNFEGPQRPARLDLIVWPSDTNLFWPGYDGPVEKESILGRYDTYFILVKSEEDPVVDDYAYKAFYKNTGEEVPREKLHLSYTGELAPGFYYGGFQYNAEVTEPVEIEIIVEFRGEPLGEPVLLVVS